MISVSSCGRSLRERPLEFGSLIAAVMANSFFKNGYIHEQSGKKQDTAVVDPRYRRGERWRGATNPAYLQEGGASCL